ncbi:hypothetical protein F5J12DRAFT_905039 [Pisolithus orientalis]|uniref:uncharacterized protein n=1 Tax=Pisolithus orientalis TaxID=936130 RepID=UPI00222538B4|nr:uncharacterized protein F5J12DRAFT_905039 [Pisolithus orientalis]KAI6009455.1 hypothetical protein F5J12DRAFT_905039 [Pisolithus orientalis]
MAPWMLNSYDVWYRDPCKEYDSTNNQRHWEDFMSGAWVWNKADRIISEDPMMAGETLIPIILSSDKTTVSVATGQTDYYPLYLSIGNVCNTVHHAHCSVVVLIGFLAMPKTTREHADIILCGDKYYQCIIYALVAYIADYKEQVLLSCIIWNWCLKCLTHQENLDDDGLCHCHEHANAVIEEFDFCKLQLFTNDFPCADICSMLSPDILHQLIKGVFKDHLVDWVKCYLIHIHGKTQAEKVLDKIDWWIAAVAPYTELWCFPQVLHRFTSQQLKVMFHNMSSSLFEPSWNFVTSFSKHIKAIKQPYWHTNHFQALGQMLLINQRLEKLIAMHANFKEHGMLNELLLSHALRALGTSQHSNDADDL